ncbi:MAG: nitrilase-related carbon-nitrogen hydrolase, partial [Verrucomicrobiota bacterium]
YRTYSEQGVRLLFIPSNFTRQTGRAHWDVLVRARAIENQSFVIAPNQCGKNTANGVESYGHSMVVGPWGEVLAQAQNLENVITCELDPAAIEQAAAKVPALDHRML